MDYVHASLSDGGNRSPEEVKIFTEKTLEDDNCIKKVEDKSTTYKVKRGQSLLYDVFKVWRELALLENSVLLNRLTKSAIVRILSVEVGDMPKEQIAPHLQGIKSLIEQKSALNVGNSMTEYTNPGPVENNIYIPTHDGKGAISTDQIGGDVNVGQLTDLDYFLNKFYGSLRGNVGIKMADGDVHNVLDMFNNKAQFIGRKVNSCNSDGSVELGTIIDINETEMKDEFLRFELEDRSYIEVTPEHRMMLKDGTFKQAKELTEEDELMSL